MSAFHRRLIVFVTFAFLAACGAPGPTSIATQAFQPKVDNSVEQTPTTTALPTVTRFPTATPNQTQTAIAQSVISTQTAGQLLIAQYPRICDSAQAAPEFSPNGLWLAESCFSEKDQDNILTISNKVSQVLRKLAYQDYIAPIEFPGGVLLVVHWAKDGRYVYFLSDIGGSGAECFYQGRDRGAGLFRLDLQSGYTTIILPPSNDIGWYGFSFSPTDRRLVYGVHARDLKILDITTGKTIDITSGDNNYETGGYLWSSDGMQLVYSVLTYNEQGDRENYSLRMVDTQSGSERILLEAPDKCFSALSWATNNVLVFERYGADGQAIIEYDLNSSTIITEATATP